MQCLTEEMRSEWVEKGYIHLKGVLDSDEVAGYLAAADAVIADYRAANPEVREQDAFINRPGRRARGVLRAARSARYHSRRDRGPGLISPIPATWPLSCCAITIGSKKWTGSASQPS